MWSLTARKLLAKTLCSCMGTKLAQQQPDPFDQATWEILIHTAWNHAGFLYKSAEPLPGAGVGQAPSQWQQLHAVSMEPAFLHV